MDHRRFPVPVLLVFLLLASVSCRKGFETVPLGPPHGKTTCLSCSHFDDFSPSIYTRFFTVPDSQSEWVIQNQEDWRDYYIASNGGLITDVVLIPQAPVDLDAKTLIVKLISPVCGQNVVPRDICFGRDRVTVKYEIDEGCCQGYILLGPSLMFAIPKTDLPVVWEETFVPYSAAPCPTPVWFIFDPPIRAFPTDAGTATCVNPSGRQGGVKP